MAITDKARNWLRDWLGVKAANDAAQWLSDATGADSGLPQLGAQRNQAGSYTWSSWVAAAINIVSVTCKAAELSVMALQGEKRKEEEAHPFELLMDNPNPLDTGASFRDKMTAWRLLTGNCYVWLNRARPQDAVAEMWILPPYELQPHPDGRLSIDGYEYRPTGTGQELFIPSFQIMHWHGYNPMTPFSGCSMIEVLSPAIKTDYAQAKWNERNFGKEQGKVPGVLAFPDPIPDAIWAKMKSEFYDSGDKEGPRRHVLLMRNTGTGTPKWVSTYMSPAEMEFMDSRRWNMEEIYNVLAPGLYTTISENSTEANSRVGAELFKSYCYGLLVDLAQRISKDVLPSYGPNLTAEFDDIREVDRALELEEQKTFAAVHTINEIRERFYEDEPIVDKRGMMFPAQIHYSISLPESTSVEPKPAPAALQPFTGAQSPPDDGDADEAAPDTTRAIMADLRRWRTAVKRRGKPYDFKSEHILRRMAAHIRNALWAAKGIDEMMGVFDEFLGVKATARFLPLGADDPRLPVPEGEVTISEQDIEAAMKSWDKAFPEIAGILDAAVIGQDQFDHAEP